jgi:hypothetical protein
MYPENSRKSLGPLETQVTAPELGSDRWVRGLGTERMGLWPCVGTNEPMNDWLLSLYEPWPASKEKFQVGKRSALPSPTRMTSSSKP